MFCHKLEFIVLVLLHFETATVCAVHPILLSATFLLNFKTRWVVERELVSLPNPALIHSAAQVLTSGQTLQDKHFIYLNRLCIAFPIVAYLVFILLYKPFFCGSKSHFSVTSLLKMAFVWLLHLIHVCLCLRGLSLIVVLKRQWSSSCLHSPPRQYQCLYFHLLMLPILWNDLYKCWLNNICLYCLRLLWMFKKMQLWKMQGQYEDLAIEMMILFAVEETSFVKEGLLDKDGSCWSTLSVYGLVFVSLLLFAFPNWDPTSKYLLIELPWNYSNRFAFTKYGTISLIFGIRFFISSIV